MIPFGAIISLAGQAASGIGSAINNRKMQNDRDAAYAQDQAYYEAKAAENPLSMSANRNIISQYDRDSKKQAEAARNIATIKGMTPEYSLGVQKGIAEGRADLMGKIGAEQTARQDKYENAAERSRMQQYRDQKEYDLTRNQTYANLASNAAKAFGSIVDSYTADVPAEATETSEKPSLVAGADGKPNYNKVIEEVKAPEVAGTATESRAALRGLDTTRISADTSALRLNPQQTQAHTATPAHTISQAHGGRVGTPLSSSSSNSSAVASQSGNAATATGVPQGSQKVTGEGDTSSYRSVKPTRSMRNKIAVGINSGSQVPGDTPVYEASPEQQYGRYMKHPLGYIDQPNNAGPDNESDFVDAQEEEWRKANKGWINY